MRSPRRVSSLLRVAMALGAAEFGLAACSGQTVKPGFYEDSSINGKNAIVLHTNKPLWDPNCQATEDPSGWCKTVGTVEEGMGVTISDNSFLNANAFNDDRLFGAIRSRYFRICYLDNGIEKTCGYTREENLDIMGDGQGKY